MRLMAYHSEMGISPSLRANGMSLIPGSCELLYSGNVRGLTLNRLRNSVIAKRHVTRFVQLSLRLRRARVSLGTVMRIHPTYLPWFAVLKCESLKRERSIVPCAKHMVSASVRSRRSGLLRCHQIFHAIQQISKHPQIRTATKSARRFAIACAN